MKLSGVAAQRSRFHLAYRLAVRSYSVSEALARGSRRSVLTGAAISLGADLGIWAVLRRTERLLLGPRLAADLIDVAAWSREVDGPPEAATLPGVPLALEAGIRLGPAAMIVPVAHFAVMTLVRRRSGRPTPPSILVWQAMGVGMGMWVSWYEQRQREATVSLHARDLAARQAAARLAGQNDVAMGADTVVDEVARVEYLLAAAVPSSDTTTPSPGTARALAEWKSSLAAATSEHSVYLATVLARYQRASYGVALADDLLLDAAHGDGTTILSAGQATQLEARLLALDLRGEIEVAVETTGTPIMPGDSIQLRIGGESVWLRADVEPVTRPFDPSPMVIVSGGIWCLSLASAGHGHAPWSVVLPAASASAALAWWSHQVIKRSGSEQAEGVVAATLGVALAQALVITPRRGAPFDYQGAQVFPLLMTANAASALGGRYWRILGRPARIRLTLSAAAALGLSLLGFDEPVRWASLAIQLVEVAALFVAFDRVQHQLDLDHGQLIDQISVADRETIEIAYADGRRFVLDLVAATTATTRRALERSANLFGPDIVAEVRHRLGLADDRLAALHQ